MFVLVSVKEMGPRVFINSLILLMAHARLYSTDTLLLTSQQPILLDDISLILPSIKPSLRNVFNLILDTVVCSHV